MPANLLCRNCGKPATHAHFIPWREEPDRVELACDSHDPGDEWYTLDELTTAPAIWLQAAQRSVSPAPQALIAWLESLTAEPKPAGPAGDGPLTVAQAAERENVDPRTIYRLLTSGKLGDGAWRIGAGDRGSWRIDPDALRAARTVAGLPKSRTGAKVTVSKPPTGMEEWPGA